MDSVDTDTITVEWTIVIKSDKEVFEDLCKPELWWKCWSFENVYFDINGASTYLWCLNAAKILIGNGGEPLFNLNTVLSNGMKIKAEISSKSVWEEKKMDAPDFRPGVCMPDISIFKIIK